MSSFKRGFTNRSPLVLAAAALLLLLAVLGFQYLFTSGAWTTVPLKYCLRKPNDSFTYVSWIVGKVRDDPPSTPAVYLLGGSSARECIVGGKSLAAEIKDLGGPTVAAYDLGSMNQSFAESMAVVDNVPDTPAWLVVGVNLGRFTTPREESSLQAEGREFLLKSEALQEFVRSRWGLEKYDYTILPGVFAYLTDWVRRDGGKVFAGKSVKRSYRLHQYTQARVHSVSQKERMVDVWNTKRYPVFARNLKANLQMLRELLRRAQERGVHVVLVELPLNREIVGDRFDYAFAEYQEPTRALAARYGATYLDFNEKLDIPNTDFHDLSHLVEPGRVVWQHALATELVRLMGETGKGGDTQ